MSSILVCRETYVSLCGRLFLLDIFLISCYTKNVAQVVLHIQKEETVKKVFLGGTMSTWREDIVIPAFRQAGVPDSYWFDPTVQKWDAQAQAYEDLLKREALLCVYVIAKPPASAESNISTYSIVEAQRSLYKRPVCSLVLFDLNGVEGRALKVTTKIIRDLREDLYGDPSCTVMVNDYEKLIDKILRNITTW